ncbi:50S ribosomal protein L4 [Candidatus Wolfebacteria bacterium CG03_land_8_20_14_0_80_40_12]|uniref:Large ribosomal subunit protein uL4 n=1 Tax=Candidatus Wolfebacteria bacterium CG03_land_8_20_14_0_80_40_12 TaxID=1975069 RepID=A0A2M7B5Z5_9BACT|nr:MAG: 50S ribosomal protein L4 [Candidatus Wolfebacteria bacterium CG03_land_8_20_14_0_80_40_12]
MTVDVFDQQNKKIGRVDLPDRIFNVKWNPDLVHQVLLAQLANSRQRIAYTKGRGEVAGGGRKPWRQKGTGRARHGSIRSPLWKGGGVTFGPAKEKKFTKKINKKMNRSAIFNVLSRKLKDGELKIVDKFNVLNKTKEWQKVLKNFIDLGSSALIIPAVQNNIHQAVKNIKKTDAISPKSLNVHDLLKAKNIILEKEAVGEIEKHYKL